MNCHELDQLLDSKAVSELTPAERHSADAHLQSCADCASAWTSYSTLAAETIPAMPETLRTRVAEIVAARLPTNARPRRSALIGGSLLIVGAAAATMALWTGDDDSVDDTASELAAAIDEPSPRSLDNESSIADSPDDGDIAIESTEPVAAQVAAASPDYVLDPRSLVVLLDDTYVDDDSTLAYCHRRLVERLSILPGLNVIAGEQVAAFANSGLSNEEVAREFGAGSVLALKRRFVCEVSLHDARTGAFMAGHVAYFTISPDFDLNDVDVDWDDLADEVDWEYFLDSVARHVNDKLLVDEATLLAESQARFLDTTLSPTERLAALYRATSTHSNLNGDVFNVAVIAALSQIMTTATEPENRRSAILAVDGLADASLVEPLLYVAAFDSTPEVRGVAAAALHTFVGESRVRDTLSQIANAEPGDNGALICCEFTVAEAARRALLSDDELRDTTMAHLKNAALTDYDRIYPFVSSLDGRGMAYALDEEHARVVFDIGSGTEDPAARQYAWSALNYGGFTSPDFVPVLLQDLAEHTVDNVRHEAANALTHYADDPAVRDRFEQILAEDLCECVRTTLTRALEAHE